MNSSPTTPCGAARGARRARVRTCSQSAADCHRRGRRIHPFHMLRRGERRALGRSVHVDQLTSASDGRRWRRQSVDPTFRHRTAAPEAGESIRRIAATRLKTGSSRTGWWDADRGPACAMRRWPRRRRRPARSRATAPLSNAPHTSNVAASNDTSRRARRDRFPRSLNVVGVDDEARNRTMRNDHALRRAGRPRRVQ